MDRQTVYYGQVVRNADVLLAQRNALVGLARLSEAVLGTPTCVAGFTLSATSPASLSATLGPGQIYQQEATEASVWSSQGVDSHVIVKQGILADPTTLSFTPPATVGYSVNILVQVQYLDQDGGALVLPYYNADNPAVPFSGPGNAGTAQNTVRQGAVAYQTKYGIAANTGSQVTPAPDAGWVGLFVVTLAQGATSVSSGNISVYVNAPFIPVTLPAIPLAVQAGSWSYTGLTTNGGNNFAGTISPNPVGLTAGMRITAKMSAAPTGASTLNINGFGVIAIQRMGGLALTGGEWAANDFVQFIYTGTAWQISSSIPAAAISSTNLVHIGDDSSVSANTITSTVTPAITSYVKGALYNISVANTVTGATNANLNGLGSRAVVRQDGSALKSGDVIAGKEVLLVDNGTSLQLTSFGRAEVLRLIANPTLYVRTDGNDANDGSANDAAHAFATINAALSYAEGRLVTTGTTVTIQLGNAGTYVAPQFLTLYGNFTIRGDTAAQGSYILSGSVVPAGNFGIINIQGGQLTLAGLTILNNSATGYSLAATASTVALANVTSTISGANTGGHMISAGAFMGVGSGCIWSGSSNTLWFVSGGSINLQPTSTTISGSPTFSVATAQAADLGQITIAVGASFIGSATGTRYLVTHNSVVNSGGGGANFFPGTVAGSTNTGGIYV